MSYKVRIALIGVGAMGRKYAEMIASGMVDNMLLAAVVVRRPELYEWAEALVNITGEKVKIYPNTDALYAEPDVFDAVLIATPHKSHAELAFRAFETGKHVMCDKPASVTVGEARKMADMADLHHLIYGVMFHQHKYPKYIKIKKLIEDGELGAINRVLLVNSRYFRTRHYHKSGSWRSSWNGEGGGALINQGAHILDMWQWLFGMPDTLSADIPFGKYNDFRVDDEATLLMHYDNDMTAVFILTTGEAICEERMEIIGSKGKALLENDTLHIWKYGCDIREYIENEPVSSRENMAPSEEVLQFEKTPEPYPQMLEEFARAVISGDPTLLSSSGRAAVNQVMLTNAAYYSAWKNERVALPIDENEYEKLLKEICD